MYPAFPRAPIDSTSVRLQHYGLEVQYATGRLDTVHLDELLPGHRQVMRTRVFRFLFFEDMLVNRKLKHQRLLHKLLSKKQIAALKTQRYRRARSNMQPAKQEWLREFLANRSSERVIAAYAIIYIQAFDISTRLIVDTRTTQRKKLEWW